MKLLRITLALSLLAGAALAAQGRGGRGGGGEPPPPLNLPPDTPRITQIKDEAIREVDKLKDFSQQMVDQIFSYGELGFQEYETSKYLVGILKKNGFSVEEGVAGMPTAFMATWGNGKPVIALGSDIDCIPQASQKPGVAYHDPLIEGAPGHGEGHNSGQAVNVTAAIVLKKIMEREKIAGTIRIWPGVADDQRPVEPLTNGVHLGTWLAGDLSDLITTYLGSNWTERHDDPELWNAILGIPAAELWNVRQALRRYLFAFIRERMRQRWTVERVSTPRVRTPH